MELRAAWQLLAPGGFLTGDDYTNHFAPVQQSVNEFAHSLHHVVPSPASWGLPSWDNRRHLSRMRHVQLLPPATLPARRPRADHRPGASKQQPPQQQTQRQTEQPVDAEGVPRVGYIARSGGVVGRWARPLVHTTPLLLPLMVRLPGQWLIRKLNHSAAAAIGSASERAQAASPTAAQTPAAASDAPTRGVSSRLDGRLVNTGREPLRCCLNGWADYSREHECRAGGSVAGKGKDARQACVKALHRLSSYSRCNVAPAPLQQATCHLPAARTECIEKFACHMPRRVKDARRT